MKFAYLLALLLPIFLVFRVYFSESPLVYGDAPYFYSSGLYDFAREPFSWMSFGNNLGGVNTFLWIYPLMFVYGALHWLGLNNDLIIRIVFYFPALVLALSGPIFLSRYLGFNKTGQFFSSLIYTLNTYFLLLIDGGQVGVALAYGIFPFGLLSLRKLADKNSWVNFLQASVSVLMLTIADPRISIICFATFLLWIFIRAIIQKDLEILRKLRVFIFLGAFLIALNSYWLIPIISLNQNLNLESSNLSKLSFLNPLFLFQPHWPTNEFGKVSLPPFYFAGVPFLIFGILFFKRERKTFVFITTFIILAFFVKGDGPPLGQIYNFLVTHVPFGGAFRDSTKFFTPLLLFGGLLIGLLLERLKSVFVIIVYLYILLLISPALLGQLNGVLKVRETQKDFQIVASRIDSEDGFLRSSWFPERNPYSFHSEQKPAIDAKNLVWERPFTSLNVGSFDHFNFLHQKDSIELFKLLGIKYLLFPGDPRKIVLSKEEQKDWDNLLYLAENTDGLKKEDWGVNFPIFSVSNTKPRIFGVNKLIAVLGSDEIYSKYSPNEYAFIFLEDGKVDPKRLSDVAGSSVVLLFNEKTSIDLTLSLLQEYFIPMNKNVSSQWAVRDSSGYLLWKYELLTKGVTTHEFDFGEGIAFSDQNNEEISFNLNAEKQGEYVLAIRSLSPKIGNDLQINFNGETFVISPGKINSFEWFTKSVNLNNGKYKITLLNPEGMSVINTIALIPKKEFQVAENLTSDFINKFGTNGNFTWQKVDYQQVSPVKYKVSIPSSVNWLIFTDTYNDKWVNAYPFYSMVNGFYVKQGVKEMVIKFKGQDYVKLGWIISLASITILAGLSLWVYSRYK